MEKTINRKVKNMNDNSSYNKLNKTIKEFNDYLAKIKKESELDEHSLAIHYDYDIVPLPDEIIDETERKK
jgi:hypothetical protein